MGKYYYGGITNLPEPLSAQDEKAALIRLEYDSTAKDLLVEHNLRLVLHMAKQFQNTEVDIEDLFSIGTLGLIKGIDTFDITKKIKLSTYISRCIRNEILMYLRKTKKWSKDISIDDPITTDNNGNTFTANDILSDPNDEDELYRTEETEYASFILSISLNLLPTKHLVAVLYSLSGMNQREIGERLSISQSYASRIRTAYHKEAIEIREFSDELLKLKYSMSQSNKRDFIFFLDNRRRFCLSIHSRFRYSFMEILKTRTVEFEIANTNDTERIIIRLPNDESSYLFCAQLIQYLSEHIT